MKIHTNIGCRLLDSDRKASCKNGKCRAYAHTFHKPGNTICIHPGLFYLPIGHQYGIIAHEVGHLLAGSDAGEVGADRAAEKQYGIKIRYRSEKRIQWLSAADTKKFIRNSKWSLRHMFGMMSVRAKDELNELLDKYEEDLKNDE